MPSPSTVIELSTKVFSRRPKRAAAVTSQAKKRRKDHETKVLVLIRIMNIEQMLKVN